MDFNHKLRLWSYHRQYLGQRGSDLLRVLKDIMAVYSSHPTAPLSLQARVRGFTEQQFSLLETNHSIKDPFTTEPQYKQRKNVAYL